MKDTIYTLPEDTFVAGQTRKYILRLLRESGRIYDADGCEVNFALLDYSHKDDDPLLKKGAEIMIGDDGRFNKIYLVLNPDDTIDLDGKYIYQLILKDTDGNTDILQGIFYIYNNINKSFMRQ